MTRKNFSNFLAFSEYPNFISQVISQIRWGNQVKVQESWWICRGLRTQFQLSSKVFKVYRISSYSLRGNYTFLNLEILALINWIFVAEIIQGRKLFKVGNYSRKYGTSNGNHGLILILLLFFINEIKNLHHFSVFSINVL